MYSVFCLKTASHATAIGVKRRFTPARRYRFATSTLSRHAAAIRASRPKVTEADRPRRASKTHPRPTTSRFSIIRRETHERCSGSPQFCLKPTYQRVPANVSPPLAPSFDWVGMKGCEVEPDRLASMRRHQTHGFQMVWHVKQTPVPLSSPGSRLSPPIPA